MLITSFDIDYAYISHSSILQNIMSATNTECADCILFNVIKISFVTDSMSIILSYGDLSNYEI